MKENDDRSSTEFEDADDIAEKNSESETEKVNEFDTTMVRTDEGRIILPWDLLQPVLRILGHCIFLGLHDKDKELQTAALTACRSLYARAIHDINPKAVIATQSLLKLVKIADAAENDDDPTEIPVTNIIVI